MMNSAQQRQYEMMCEYSVRVARRYQKLVTSKEYIESFAKHLEKRNSRRRKKRLN